jgi:alanine racemase
MPQKSERPTLAQVDLSKLRSNFRSSKKFIGGELKYMAVVKANAYGHGAVQCASALADEGVDWLGVALLKEALELRHAGISVPILCLGGLSPGQEHAALTNDVTPVVFNLEQAKRLNAAANELGQRAKVHVKIDTGMGRLGIRWDHIGEFIGSFKELQHLEAEALMTHFAAADDLELTGFTETQIERFHGSVRVFEAAGIKPSFVDMANSPAAVAYPQARPHMVRLGGILYGLDRDVLPPEITGPEVQAVMSLHSVIADVKMIPAGDTIGYGRTFRAERPTQIALIPIGYSDGYPRALSNKAKVIIDGRPAPVVGRISMDWTIVDVTDVDTPNIGDRVTLIGLDGDIEITAPDLAAICGTISYEITCGIGSRVPRVYQA